jgi:hypothetical protein
MAVREWTMSATQSLMPMREVRNTWLSLSVLGVLGACADSDRVSFAREIKPLLAERCVVCHYSAQDYTDLENPFNTEPGFAGGNHGAVGGGSVWFQGHQYGPPLNVAPYEPDNSYLLEKVSNRDLLPEACTKPGPCLSDDAGFFMPPSPRPLTEEQIESVRTWIAEGADPGVFRDRLTPTPYRQGNAARGNELPHGYSLLNLFGNFSNVAPLSVNDPCAFVVAKPGCNLCGACHREGGPYYPQGVTAADFINVTSTFRTDLKLVVPGKPEESFLMMKLDGRVPSSELGSPMPHGYAPLSDEKVARIRQWIAEGAKDN